MKTIMDVLVSLSGPLVYIVVGALAFTEAAAFVGLVLPGETALFVGGVIASQGHANLGVMLGVAVVAAITGDSVGYEVGRRFGPALKNSRAGRFVGEDKWAKGEQFLARRGGTAVLLGRWVGLLRALVPAIAGMARMPYRTFLLYNSIGGTIWAVVIVLLGYYAGQSYKTVEQYLGKASLILTLVLAGVLCLALLARFALKNQRWTRARIQKSTSLPGVSRVLQAQKPRAAQVPITHRRRSVRYAGMATPLLLTLILIALTVGYNIILGTGPGQQLTSTIAGPIRAWFSDHQDDEFTILMQFVTILGHPVTALLVLLVCMIRVRADLIGHVRRYTLFLSGAVVAAVLAGSLTRIVLRTTTVTSAMTILSPAGQTLMATALLTGSAGLIIRFGPAQWRLTVLALTGLTGITPVIALSHIYLGQQNPLDIILGWILGTLFTALLTMSWVMPIER